MSEEQLPVKINTDSPLAKVVRAAGFLNLEHVLVMGGSPYVTHDGLLWWGKHNFDGEINGTTVDAVIELCDPSKDSWTFRCDLWIKGLEKPFTGYGHARPDNVSKIVRNKGRCEAMAQTRAEGRAMRKAFAIEFPTYDEVVGAQEDEVIEVKAEVKDTQPSKAAESTDKSGISARTELSDETKALAHEFVRLRDEGLSRGIFKEEPLNRSLRTKILGNENANINPFTWTPQQIEKALALARAKVPSSGNGKIAGSKPAADDQATETARQKLAAKFVTEEIKTRKQTNLIKTTIPGKKKINELTAEEAEQVIKVIEATKSTVTA